MKPFCGADITIKGRIQSIYKPRLLKNADKLIYLWYRN